MHKEWMSSYTAAVLVFSPGTPPALKVECAALLPCVEGSCLGCRASAGVLAAGEPPAKIANAGRSHAGQGAVCEYILALFSPAGPASSSRNLICAASWLFFLRLARGGDRVCLWPSRLRSSPP